MDRSQYQERLGHRLSELDAFDDLRLSYLLIFGTALDVGVTVEDVKVCWSR